MSRLQSSKLAPGLLLGEGVSIGADVTMGGHVVIHDGAVIGDGCTIQDAAILGKPPQLGARSTASGSADRPLVVEPGSRICCAAVICAGVRIGQGAVIGDHAFIRELAEIGAEAVIGHGASIGRGVSIGARCKLQVNTMVATGSVLEEDVFLGPGACITNDVTMGRHGAERPAAGVRARRACRIGAAAVLMPGVEIGAEAVVAAGALVTRDVPARTVVVGSPAQPVRRIEDDEVIERWS